MYITHPFVTCTIICHGNTPIDDGTTGMRGSGLSTDEQTFTPNDARNKRTAKTKRIDLLRKT